MQIRLILKAETWWPVNCQDLSLKKTNFSKNHTPFDYNIFLKSIIIFKLHFFNIRDKNETIFFFTDSYFIFIRLSMRKNFSESD